MTQTKDYLELHFIVLIWGFTAILGKLISIPPVELVFYRTLLAATALGLMLRYQKEKLAIPRRDIFTILGTGALIALHWILFFGAARVANVSICLAGMATTSFWTSIFEPLLTRRRIKGFELGLGVVVIFGLYLVFKFQFDHALGLGMAVMSALLAAWFTVINGKLTKRHGHFLITFYEMAGACLVTILFFPVYGSLINDGLQLKLQGWDFLYLLLLALACTVYSYSASVRLMRRISAFMVNLTVNLEPVYGIILAVIIFGDSEKMDTRFYMGTAVILLSVLSYPVLNRRFSKKALETDTLR